MKPLPLICAVIACVCLFVAYDQYQSNVAAVEMMNQLGGDMLSQLNGNGRFKAAVPAATKYALLAAIITGILSVVFHQQSKTIER